MKDRLDNNISLALPPSIQQLLLEANEPIQQGLGLPSYAEGGLIGAGGVPQRGYPQGQMPQRQGLQGQARQGMQGQMQPDPNQPQPTYEELVSEIANLETVAPEYVARIRAAVDAGVQSGEIDAELLNMFGQMAITALQNPEMYPQLRQSIISQGLAEPEDIPEEFDVALVSTFASIAQSMAADVQFDDPAQQDMDMQAGMAPQQMRQGLGTGEAVPIEAHEGEFVIPQDVVQRLGTKFFDDTIRKAREQKGS